MTVITGTPAVARRRSPLAQLTRVEFRLFFRERVGPIWGIGLPVLHAQPGKRAGEVAHHGIEVGVGDPEAGVRGRHVAARVDLGPRRSRRR